MDELQLWRTFAALALLWGLVSGSILMIGAGICWAVFVELNSA